MSTTTPPTSASASEPPTSARTTPAGASTPANDDAAALTRLLRRLHFYAGILVGPFLLVAAISGFLYAVAPSIDGIYRHDLLTARSTAQTAPVSAQVAAAENAFPTLQANGIVVPQPGRTTMVLFKDPTLGDGYSRAAFVDPADGRLHGTSTVFGSTYALPERAWLDQLHDNLLLGEPGRVYAELAASWLAPVTLVGIWLWWRQRRTTGRARALSTRGKARTTHTTVGLVMALGFLFLSVTGLTWSRFTGEHISSLRTAMDWKTPSVSTTLPGTRPAPEGKGGMAGMDMGGMDMSGAHQSSGDGPVRQHGTADHIMPGMVMSLDGHAVDRVARTASRLRAPYLVTVSGPGKAWTAKETRRSWTMGPDALAISPRTGAVTAAAPFASFPVAAKLTDWGIRLHMGFLFGLANQLVLAAIAASLVVVIVHGYRMWWLRRPTRREGFAVGRPPRRGALRRLFRAHPVTWTLAALVVAAVGWAVPLLGISLVAFLVVDSAIGSARRTSSDGSCC